ncbi:hypothetical protein [Hydrogenimonas cancrithermarum]|uniref:DUF4381 domain-containing protein n=1 Tax=Hydrogenimonas cancrithermarum TaxID=2993563 RepID=A0ABM8FJU2_9BACT|nr:hypothetical protein [Hydrogenimonas cancrithermarum]BDY12567.1 hypothetical protein HCR_08790 [Hydrogenimonas cancrithermarum]
MNPEQLPIRDIKPLLPIPDVSFYLFVGFAGVGVLVLSAILIFVWKWWQKHRRIDPRIGWLRQLDSIDYGNPKKAAYVMTKYGRLLAEDKRRQEILEQLLPRLERYKYRKKVPPLDEETKRFMKLFIEMSHDAL